MIDDILACPPLTDEDCAEMARRRIDADAPMVSEPVEVRAHDQLDLFGSEVAG